jgi:hypothetical protein
MGVSATLGWGGAGGVYGDWDRDIPLDLDAVR